MVMKYCAFGRAKLSGVVVVGIGVTFEIGVTVAVISNRPSFRIP